jgi:hypothetical protein
MIDEQQGSDPYATVIADLKKKRDEIDRVIQSLEALRAGAPVVAAASGSASGVGTAAGVTETAGMFLGMSIPDAARKLLAMRKRTMGNVEIARELRDGGMVLKSKDPVNVVGSVLTRRFNDVGDVVKVGRGIWGLKEWYPGRNFKTIGKGNIVMVTPSADGMSETGEQVREGDEPPLDLTDAVK